MKSFTSATRFGAALACAWLGAGCTEEATWSEALGESSRGLHGSQGPVRGRFQLDPVEAHAVDLLNEGRAIFRYETFGDEAFWGGQLRLHEAIAGQANGGVGPGISPAQALSLGLRVDVEALPRALRRALRRGQVDLRDPATTLDLMKLDAVIGLKGFFSAAGQIESVGIQCALCHSTVDDSFMPGFGRRQDGWPNRDLDVGALVALAPDLTAVTSVLGVSDAALRDVLRGWGPGRFDAFVNLDGQVVRPDGKPAATMIPALFDLSGVGLMGWNGWGPWGAWMPFIIILEMRGQGNFRDSRLNDPVRFPVAAANRYGSIRVSDDRVSPTLPALQQYVNALTAPEPPPGYFDPVKAERGRSIFESNCQGCHAEGTRTITGWNIVPAFVIGIDSFQADRSPNRGYRPPPLRGMFTRKNGFFHDGRFQTLAEVVEHFDTVFRLNLAAHEKDDVVEYLKSL